MPGVVVTTAVRSGPTGVGDIESGQLFVVGQTERGPIDEAVLVRSFSEFTTYFGGYTTAGTLYVPVKTFFEEGGSRCWVSRSFASGAAAASFSVLEAANPEIDFVAADPGLWGNDLTVAVLDADSLVSGFRIQIALDGVVILTTPDMASNADAVAFVNTSSISHLVVAAVASGAAAVPDVVAAQSFTNGSDATTGTSDADRLTALDLFEYGAGAGAVAMPGETGTVTWDDLAAHAKANNRIALCAFGAADAPGTVKTAAAFYYGNAAASSMAFYYPHIKVADPTTSGLTVTVSPETMVAAARSKAIQASGSPFRAPAGLISGSSSYVKGVASSIDKAAGDLLDEARVNAIRTIGGQVRVYGARSVSSDDANWRFITFQDMLNHVVVDAENRLEEFVFATIDSRGGLFGAIKSSMIAMLDPLRLSGALYEAFDSEGERIDPGYSVVVNDENNPVAQLATGLVKVEVGIRVSSVGDKINITISKSNLTASVV